MAARLKQKHMWPPERPAFDGTVTRIIASASLQVPVRKDVSIICKHSAEGETSRMWQTWLFRSSKIGTN